MSATGSGKKANEGKTAKPGKSAEPQKPGKAAGGDAQAFHEFTLDVEQTEDYAFRVRFDKASYTDLVMDEPAPLGKENGPNAARVLAAAIGNCLSASLLFCARKGRIELGPIHSKVTVRVGRNERNRLRIQNVRVEIDPGVPEAEKQKALRCLDLFEDYCVVTQSIRRGIPVEVHVKGLQELRVSREK